MIHKFSVSKDPESDVLTIREFAEVDTDIFSLTCVQTYPGETIRRALATSGDTPIHILRTRTFFPTRDHAEQLLRIVSALYDGGSADTLETTVDDAKFLSVEPKKSVPAVADEEESDESDLDELLDDDLGDDYDEEDLPLDSLKIVDDDDVDVDEDL